jgi:predicted CDP-diglyceride synthetase/phosphatidate cytidylyltransferase
MPMFCWVWNKYFYWYTLLILLTISFINITEHIGLIIFQNTYKCKCVYLYFQINTKDFVLATHTHSIPLILLDLAVLNKVINITSPQSKKCHFFCELVGVTVFGVLHKLWNHEVQVSNNNYQNITYHPYY